jgi:G3E family GTPase
VTSSDVGISSDGRMRLSVLGGYLGSGKTTWLRHQLHAGAFRDALVIVNEAAETPVDDALLQGSSKLVVLAGGCACCTGKAELIACLRQICDERSKLPSDQPRLQRIVLETSGLADPAPIVEAIRSDPVLVHHILVSEVLVTVDALHALAQLRSEPLGRRQIEIADRFMVTKLDESPAEHVRKLLATLLVMNPGAVMSGSVRGSEVTLPDIGDAEPEILASIAEGEEQAPIFPTRIVIDNTIDWAAFSVWLSALLHARGDDVVRVKGVVRTPAGRLLVQTVRKIVQSPEMLPEQDDRPDREDDVIVVIGRGYAPEALTKSLRYFAARSPSAT